MYLSSPTPKSTSIYLNFVIILSQLLLFMNVQNSSETERPFSPCPGTPNCVIESHSYNIDPKTLFDAIQSVMAESNTYRFEANPDELTIDTVFRIPIFGFKDDLKIAIQRDSDDHRSILHIKSSSRVGRSDLGVNQRRINRIISKLNKNLS